MGSLGNYTAHVDYDWRSYTGTGAFAAAPQETPEPIDFSQILDTVAAKVEGVDDYLREDIQIYKERLGVAVNERDKLKSQLKEVTQENSALKTSLEEVAIQHRKAKQDIDTLISQMRAADEDILSLSDANKKLQSELETIHVELFNLREESRRIKNAETEYCEEIERLTEELAKEAKEHARFERKAQEYKRKLEIKTAEYDNVLEKLETANEERNIYQTECIRGNLTGYNKPAGYSASDIYALKEDFKSLQEKSQLTSISFKSGKAIRDTTDTPSFNDSYKVAEKYAGEPSLATVDLSTGVHVPRPVKDAAVLPRVPRDLAHGTLRTASPPSAASTVSTEGSDLSELFAKYASFDTNQATQDIIAKYSVTDTTLDQLLNKVGRKQEATFNPVTNQPVLPKDTKPSLLERQLRQEQHREMQKSSSAELAELLTKYELPPVSNPLEERFGTTVSRSASHTLALGLLEDKGASSTQTQRYWTTDQPLLSKYTAEYGF